MDVQLHLHPQWFIRVKEPKSRIDSRWNLGLLEDTELRELVTSAKQKLENIGRSYNEGYRVIAFKAGSWGLTPLQRVISVLKENQIQLVIGLSGNIIIPSLNIDYRKFRSRMGIVNLYKTNIMLMTEIRHGILDILLLVYGIARKTKRPITKSKYSLEVSPLEGAKLSYFKGFKFITHLRMNWQSPLYVIRVLKKFFKSNPEADYAYVETHTKDFGENQLNSPSLFNTRLGAEYEFITITEYASKYIRFT